MDINSFGEFELIKKFSQAFSTNLDTGALGIGDDCSVVPINQKLLQLTTTDLLVEKIHFLKDKISPFDLGQKSLAVNISDIAAMGGSPEHAYLSIGLPNDLDIKFIDEFFEGFHQYCEKYKIKLLGGDTTKSPGPIIINILIQGVIKKENLKLRSQAKNGDYICVTGSLGDSGIGLGILTKGWKTHFDDYFIKKHHCPIPEIEEGQWLAQFDAVHAMIDLSDGAASDINHICNMSQVGAAVELSKIPISKEAQIFFQKYSGINKNKVTLSSGEDYCLLVTISKENFKKIASEFKNLFSKDLTPIGTINESNKITFYNNGELIDETFNGFDHFRGTE